MAMTDFRPTIFASSFLPLNYRYRFVKEGGVDAVKLEVRMNAIQYIAVTLFAAWKVGGVSSTLWQTRHS